MTLSQSFVRWLGGLGCCLVLACQAAVPLPEAPRFDDLAAYSVDPAIGELIGKRLDVARDRPDQAQAWISLGFAFEANGFKAEAATCYEHAAELQSREREINDAAPLSNAGKVFYRLGVVRQSQGDLESAAAAFATAAELQPSLTAAHWQRGYSWLDLGHLDRASASFQKAVDLEPNGLPGRLGLVRVALQEGRADDAERRLQSMLEAFPAQPYLHFLLADAWRQQGRHDEVAQVLPAADGEAPEWPDPWQEELQGLRVGFSAATRRAQEALQQGRLDIAVPLLEKLHREHPEAIVVTTNLGAAYIGSGRAEEAIPLLMAAQETHPGRFNVAMNLAAAHFTLGDLDRAASWAQTAHELDPLKPRPLQMIGEVHRRRQKPAAALAAYQEALELAPNDLNGWLQIGGLHEGQGRWNEAQEAYLQAVRLAPRRGDLAMHLARAFLGMGRPKYAHKALDQARELGIPAPLQPQFDQLTQQIDAALQRLERSRR